MPISRFVRTTWMLSASVRLDLPNQSMAVRRITPTECDEMLALARSRNVFARHSWENSFYLERIAQLKDATVVEVFLPGTIDEIVTAARDRVEFLERVALVSAIFGIRRRRMLQMLGISSHRRSGFDLVIAPGFEFMRSAARPEIIARGISIDSVFQRRFARGGFESLLHVGVARGQLAERLRQGVRWVAESRQEPELSAAIVKTAIGLESLLIANDSESLRGPLSERAAYLLTDDPKVRRRIGTAVKKFYDLRSGIVHGGRRKTAVAPTLMIEGVDRLLVLLAVTIAANASQFSTFDDLVEVLNEKKWGGDTAGIVRPFRNSFLTRAIQLLEGQSGASAI